MLHLASPVRRVPCSYRREALVSTWLLQQMRLQNAFRPRMDLWDLNSHQTSERRRHWLCLVEQVVVMPLLVVSVLPVLLFELVEQLFELPFPGVSHVLDVASWTVWFAPGAPWTVLVLSMSRDVSARTEVPT